MNTSELMKKIKDAEQQIADARRMLEEHRKNGAVRPNIGDRFYYINQRGKVLDMLWTSDPMDEDGFKIGNVFHTEENAERAARRLKTHQKIKEFAYRYNGDETIDLNDWKKRKCYLAYNICEKQLCFCYTGRLIKSNTIYFKDEYFLDHMLKEIPENELIEYCRGDYQNA